MSATLGGIPCTKASVSVPAWGLWWAGVDLAEPEALSGSQTLKVADKTLIGTIVSGGVENGRASYRLVGGAGGWGKELPRKSYRNDTGVKVSNVIADAARSVGETLGALPTTRLGTHFARREGLASAVLHLLAPKAWYVDFDGVTQFGARATVAYAGDGARTRIDPAGAIVEIATEEIGALEPGVTIDGSAPATDVEYIVDPKRLTVRVYAGARKNRRLDALSRTIEALFPDMRYRGVFEFRVVTQTGDRLNLQPARVASGFSDLPGVPVRGPAGVRADVQLGELVLVAFADADPSRPNVIAHDAPDAPGWMPLFVELGEGPTLGVARIGDTVQAGPFAGVITSGSARIKAGL